MQILYKLLKSLSFTCDFSDAGDADLDVHLVNEDNRQEIPVKLTDNGDRTYTVDYEAPQSGNYSVTLDYGGLRVPTTPIKFKVEPNIDVSKIKVDGLEPSKFFYYSKIYILTYLILSIFTSTFSCTNKQSSAI